MWIRPLRGGLSRDLACLGSAARASWRGLRLTATRDRRQRADEDGTLRDATRLHTARFATAVSQPGQERPAVRLGGVHALAGLAGDARSVDPTPMLGNLKAAQAALRNWVLSLHKELAGTGVQAAHVAIGVWVGTDGPPGVPAASAEEIAGLYWDLHTQRDDVERVFTR